MKTAAETVKSETKKSVARAAKKAPKAKRALKRMVSEIDAQTASRADNFSSLIAAYIMDAQHACRVGTQPRCLHLPLHANVAALTTI